MTSALAVESASIARLREWDRNPRSIAPGSLERLKRSLAAEPQMLDARPVIALPDGTVVAGNMRLRAARELGWDAVPTVFVDLSGLALATVVARAVAECSLENVGGVRMEGVKPLEILRRVAIAAAVPVHFSLQSGHLRSALIRRSVDAKGRPIPWYTYSAIDFLAGVPLGEARVLEFGSGYSTLWWADHAESVLSLEANPRWYEDIKRRLGERSNVEYVLSVDPRESRPAYPSLVPGDPAELKSHPRGGEFDVVIVDAAPRDICSNLALSVLADDGMMILDNPEGGWSSRGLPGHPIIDLFNDAGFARIDFYGYAPGVFHKQCTSLFFKQLPRLLRRLPAPSLT